MPPGNDDFANATDLGAVPGSIAGDTFDATQEGGEPNWFFDWSAQSVWYTFTPAVTGTYLFEILISSLTYTGSGSGSHLMLAASDDGLIDTLAEWTNSHFNIIYDTYVAPGSGGIGGSDDLKSYVALTSGTTYWIRVSSNRNSGIANRNVCSFTLTHELVPPPANDDFANATVISGESGSEPDLDLHGATNEVDEPVQYYWYDVPLESAWYEWTAPSDGRYKFSFEGIDGVIAVFTGAAVNALTPIARADDAGGEFAEDGVSVGFIATSGTTYMIDVGARVTEQGIGHLEWEKLSDPEGTDQASAITVTGGTLTGDNFGYQGSDIPAGANERLRDSESADGNYTDFTLGAAIWFKYETGALGVALDLTTEYRDGMYAVLVYEDVAGTPTAITDADGDDAAYVLDYDLLENKVVSFDPNKTYYIVVAGWTTSDYAGVDGETAADVAGISFSFEILAATCVIAEDVINPDASSRFDGSAATVVSGRVRETWEANWDFGGNPQTCEDWTLAWTWAGAAGQYLVEIFGQMGGSGTPGAGRVYALFRVNGKMVTTQGNSGDPPSSLDPFSWEGFNGGVSYPNDLHENPWLVLKPGDAVEVLFISQVSNGSFAFMPFECDLICFTLAEDALATTYCTPTWDFGDHPLGDAWGSPNGWGGQMLIPDQIWTHLGITPYDEGDFPWGVDYVDFDMCALADGTVYVIFKDGWNHGLGLGLPGGTSEYHYTVIKKYDPGSETWTQLATINVQDPEDSYATDAVSCEPSPDGAFVYFSWWEVTSRNTAPTPDETQWDWHLLKLDTSDDSMTELGTGQHAITVASAGIFINIAQATLANHILPLDDGTVYVAAIEYANDRGGAGFDQHLFVWRWNGSTWTDLSLPAPSDLGTDTWWEVNGENSFYDRVPTMVAAHSDGPVSNGFTLTYPYTYLRIDPPSYFEGFQSVTISYTVGTGWHDEILSDWSTLLKQDMYGQTPEVDFSPKRDIAFDVDILWSELLGRLVLVTDIVGSGSGGPWLIWQMNDDGDQWEHIETPATPTPASIAAPWRQGRNTSAIGPDGNVFRGLISEWNADINFIPRVAKHSPGYNAGFANAARSEVGQVTDKDFPWNVWMFATTNYRIRILGNEAYIMMNVYAESAGYNFGEEEYADAFYVFKLSYNPCSTFRPHIYRRILG